MHDEKIQKPARSSQAIAALALNYFLAQKENSGIRRQGWEKPKEGFVKLNIDAAFSSETFSGGSGAVIRDDRGLFIAASCSGIPNVRDAATAEARALRDGLILASQIGCTRIEVESDCSEVVEIMQDGGNSLGPAAAIYEECSFLSRGFGQVIFMHTPRENNTVAHCIASLASGSHTVVWHEDPLDCIIGLLANDVTLVNV